MICLAPAFIDRGGGLLGKLTIFANLHFVHGSVALLRTAIRL